VTIPAAIHDAGRHPTHALPTMPLRLLCALIVAAGVYGVAAAEPGDASLSDSSRPFLATHCFACHDAEVQEGKVNLADLPLRIATIEQAEVWQKVLGVVNSGEMPPEEEPQPDGAAKADFLADLAEAMVAARRSLADSGGTITLRRLNRREYRNTLEHLLGTSVRGESLPDDATSGSFDTVGASLFLSSDQFEEYLKLGRTAIDEAFTRHAASTTKPAVFRLEPETTLTPEEDREVKHFEESQERFLRWKTLVDQAAAAPENQSLVAELREKHPEIVKHPDIFIYYHANLLKGCPDPKEFGFQDASSAAFSNQQYLHLYPFYRHYFDLPHRQLGTYLKLPHHGASFRSRIDVEPPAEFPPGRYVLRLRAGVVEGVKAARRFVEVGLPQQTNNLPTGLEGVSIATLQLHGTVEHPEIVETRVELRASSLRKFSLQERQPRDFEQFFQHIFPREKQATGYGYEPSIWIDWIELEGPLPERGTASLEKIMELQVPDGLSARAAAERGRDLLAEFARVAFRDVEPEASFIDQLVDILEGELARGQAFAVAIRTPLSIILASPSFLYLFEPGTEHAPRTLTQRELAVRLAAFLWSGPPDERLLTLAARDELHRPEVLRAEVDRMIDDVRSDQFVSGFVHQWLDMKRLDFFQFDVVRHREFDESTRVAARQEVYESFAHLLRDPEHGRLGNLLKSDYVLVNDVLATYYGIDSVTGEGFRRVALPADSPRGGLLGMAAIHAMGSNGVESSPVERGAWVLRHLLNDPPPPAPPNVPQLSRLSDKPLTTRERLAAHREQPQCASCHRKIDPIGFGLENFDAAGKWRTTDRHGGKTWTIDAADTLFQGSSFADFRQLRDLIAAREDDFASGFTKHLIEYALGRPFGFADEDMANRILTAAKHDHYALRTFLHAIVQSREFQTK
jgi:cytochrome c553